MWWGGVYADGECVWGWGGGCGERGCGRGRLGSVEGVIDWGEWVWVWWCSKVDGGQGLCKVRKACAVVVGCVALEVGRAWCMYGAVLVQCVAYVLSECCHFGLSHCAESGA